jgi:hypothetical protein
VLETIDTFYADVGQHIKPWTPRPVKVRDDEPCSRKPGTAHGAPTICQLPRLTDADRASADRQG